MDNFKVKDLSNSGSSGSADIDLDDIARMIDPLDDLEENLFSSKPRTNVIKNPHSTSIKDLPDGEKSLTRKNADESEVLTSMSSSNSPTNNTSGILSKKLEVGKGEDMTVGEGTVFKGRRHTGFSNKESKTGLWNGDDLWKLDDDEIKTNKTTTNLHSPLKSYGDTTTVERPNSEKGLLKSSAKVSVESNAILTQSSGKRTAISTVKKSGKFDWLGLLDDDSGEEKDKQISDKGESTALDSIALKGSEQSHEKVSPLKGKKDSSNFSGNTVNNSKELGKFERPQNVLDPTSDLQSKSVSESLNVVIPKGTLKSGEVKRVSSIELVPGNSLGEIVSSINMEAIPGISKGGKSKLDLEKQNDETSLNKRGSISEEVEATSGLGYAPTFLGGQSEGSGRRRRRPESKETPPASKGFSSNFDPLGLFLMEDADKVDVTPKDKKPLPDWLMDDERKLSDSQKNDSKLEEAQRQDGKEERSLSESKKELHSENSPTVASSLTENNASKSLKPTSYMSSIISNGKEVKNIGGEVQSHKGSHNIESENEVKKLMQSNENDLDQGDDSQKSQSHYNDHTVSPREFIKNASKKVTLVLTPEIPSDELLSKVQIPTENIGNKSKMSGDINYEEMNEKVDREGDKKKASRSSPLKITLHSRDRKDEESDEFVDDSSPVVENHDQRNGSFKKLTVRERRYLRRIQDLEERVGHVDYLEEELAKMRFLEGEVEHLKAVIHVVELEKSAAEGLVGSLQERHADQIKRLEEVHRNEVNGLNQALLREEKRGAEEIRRLSEEHRKTLDRLLEANVRMEEEFRNRMQEARRDWSRDVEAMRQAYQQSNNAAITNASLAVLTGHSFGISEARDKSESSKRDDSSAAKAVVPQCPEEVKELNHTVERVESILIQTLEAIVPKGNKTQNEKKVLSDAESTEQRLNPGGITKKLHKPARKRKSVMQQKFRKSRGINKINSKVNRRKAWSEEYEEDTIDSDSSFQVEETFKRRGSRGKESNHLPNKNTHFNKKDKCICDFCSCRLHHYHQEHIFGNLVSDDCQSRREKSIKDGRNFQEYNKEYLREHRRKEQKHFSWNDMKDMRQMNGRQEGDDRFTFNGSRLLDGVYVSQLYHRKHSGVIINPKEYMMQLAAGNISNLFQPSGNMTS